MQKIKGQMLKSKTLVSNLELAEQQVTSLVEGWLYGVTVSAADTEGRVCAVFVSLTLSPKMLEQLQNSTRRFE